MSLMGIDVGTSGCKALVMSTDGRILTRSEASYTIHSRENGIYELNPEEVWEKVTSCIQECNGECVEDPVVALALTTQGEAIIPLDALMNPLSFAPISADLRGARYVNEFEQLFGKDYIFSLTGQNIEAIHSIFKIKSWQQSNKTLHKTCWKYCCFDTYINLCLGLPPVTDRSMAARMMLYDITKNVWDPDLLAYVGIDAGKLPEVVSSGTIIGILSKEKSRELGFSHSISIISGGHDQPCAAFGNGMIDSGVSYSIGTTECISIVRNSEDVQMIHDGNPTYPHVIEHSLVTLVGSQTGTRFFSWLHEILYNNQFSGLLKDKKSFYDLIRAVPPSLTTPVIFLPHLSGGSTHYANPNAKAHLFNFSQETTTLEFIKAALESITIEQYMGYKKFLELNQLEAMDTPIVATGGGVRFTNWIEIKASIFNRPFQLMQSYEAGCIGAAMLAGIGINAFSSAKVAVKECVHKQKIIKPDVRMSSYYDEKIEQFDVLYHSVNMLKNRR
jgi:xylulokinase